MGDRSGTDGGARRRSHGGARRRSTSAALVFVLSLAATGLLTASPSSSEPVVLTFGPVADTFVEANAPTRSNGAAPTLEVDDRPVKHILLKFTVSGVGSSGISRAALRLYSVDRAPTGGDVYAVPDPNWDEAATWGSAPAEGPTPIASLGKVVAFQWYEVDVTSLVSGDGTYSLKLTSTSSNGADFVSKEGTAGLGPQLAVELAPPDDSTAPTAAITGPAAGETLTGITVVQVDASDDLGVASVDVLLDGWVLGTATGAPYEVAWDTRGSGNGPHELVAVAHDGAGNVGASEPVAVTVDNPVDTTPPQPPTNLTATAVGTTRVDLSWDPSSDDVGVSSYAVQRDGVQIAEVPSTSFSDTTVGPDTTYAYRVTAFDVAGNPSDPSQEVIVTTGSADAYPPPATDVGFGRFRIVCPPSHRAQVDPIVAPGPSGTPSHHMHEFFGNVSTDSDSTYGSMLAAGTTCGLSADKAGYWIPSLVGPDGSLVDPRRMVVYYTNRPVGYGTTTAFLPDFRVIAGGVGGYPHAYWTCDTQSDHSLPGRAATPPDCGDLSLKLHVFFPSCWDGLSTDSSDHRSHVTYAFNSQDGSSTDINDDTCPESHPVKIPQIRVRVIFPVSDGPQYQLADGTTSPHADFWNTWDQAVLGQVVADCLRAGVTCDLLQD